MAQQTKEATVGAAFNLEPSPYGDQAVRAEWVAKVDACKKLDQAVTLLREYRAEWDNVSLSSVDSLWIEARIEERVAVLRFDSMTTEEVRTRTLTNESIAEVCARFEERVAAAEAAKDARELERINHEFRSTYRPPMMPSSPFMRTEVAIAQALMKVRTVGWYDLSIHELREARGVGVIKTGE